MIQLTDVDGKKIWVNPSAVLYVRANVQGYAVIFFPLRDRAGDIEALVVKESPDEVSKKFKKG